MRFNYSGVPRANVSYIFNWKKSLNSKLSIGAVEVKSQ